MMIIHTHDYDSDYIPPMPVIEIQTRRRSGQSSVMLKAIIDTGADATMIPLTTLRQINARKGRTSWLSSAVGGRYEVDLYMITVQIGNHLPLYVDVVGSERIDEVIIGRDVLNQFIVTLNALASTVEVAS